MWVHTVTVTLYIMCFALALLSSSLPLSRNRSMDDCWPIVILLNCDCCYGSFVCFLLFFIHSNIELLSYNKRWGQEHDKYTSKILYIVSISAAFRERERASWMAWARIESNEMNEVEESEGATKLIFVDECMCLRARYHVERDLPNFKCGFYWRCDNSSADYLSHRDNNDNWNDWNGNLPKKKYLFLEQVRFQSVLPWATQHKYYENFQANEAETVRSEVL